MTQTEQMRNAIEEAEKLLCNEAVGYSMTMTHVFALCDRADHNIFGAVCDAFHYGFIKGLRYQKAQKNKKKV